MKKTVGVVGYGYVGKAMVRFLEGHYDVLVYDPQSEEIRGAATFVEREQINECDVAFVCVPTPSTASGECDTSIVEEVVGWLETPLILIKSTVSIGTTERLRRETGKRIVFSPEYCGESSYWTPYDFHTEVKSTPFFIFGGEPKDTSELVDLYMPITGPTKTYRQTTSRSAESAKYMANVFFATKILFCYEMSELLQAMGVDYNEVRDLWMLDPRLNSMHTSVFSTNEVPFSGKCFPKDTKALVKDAERSGYEAKFLKEVLVSNQRLGTLRKKRHDDQ